MSGWRIEGEKGVDEGFLERWVVFDNLDFHHVLLGMIENYGENLTL
jgi:hypothetical protein